MIWIMQKVSEEKWSHKLQFCLVLFKGTVHRIHHIHFFYFFFFHFFFFPKDLNVFLICISFDPCLCLSHFFSSISHSPNSFSLSSHYQMHHVLWQNETLAFTQCALCYHRWNKRQRWKSYKKKKNRHFLFKHHCHVKMTSPPLHSEHERGVGELQCHF